MFSVDLRFLTAALDLKIILHFTFLVLDLLVLSLFEGRILLYIGFSRPFLDFDSICNSFSSSFVYFFIIILIGYINIFTRLSIKTNSVCDLSSQHIKYGIMETIMLSWNMIDSIMLYFVTCFVFLSIQKYSIFLNTLIYNCSSTNSVFNIYCYKIYSLHIWMIINLQVNLTFLVCFLVSSNNR